jgi:hypothetical protein
MQIITDMALPLHGRFRENIPTERGEVDQEKGK